MCANHRAVSETKNMKHSCQKTKQKRYTLSKIKLSHHILFQVRRDAILLHIFFYKKIKNKKCIKKLLPALTSSSIGGLISAPTGQFRMLQNRRNVSLRMLADIWLGLEVFQLSANCKRIGH